MKVCLPEFFEITGRQQGELPRGLETDSDFLDKHQNFFDNRWGDLVIAKGYSRVSLCLNLLDCAYHRERSMISSLFAHLT
jgi:hypothetical protein